MGKGQSLKMHLGKSEFEVAWLEQSLRWIRTSAHGEIRLKLGNILLKDEC